MAFIQLYSESATSVGSVSSVGSVGSVGTVGSVGSSGSNDLMILRLPPGETFLPIFQSVVAIINFDTRKLKR